MALFKFTKAILEENLLKYIIMEITRDFTYIDDIVEGVIKTLDNIATGNSIGIQINQIQLAVNHLGKFINR